MAVSFTKAQQDAIDAISSNTQIIACAGAGKTEVVARRIAKLLTPKAQGGGGLTPANVVAFTFTEKAAAELKDRVIQRCREHANVENGMAEMYIGTIHGFCLELLKTEVPKFLKYEVLDEVQQALFIDRSSAKSGLTTSTDLTGAQLRRYVDTGTYIRALAVLRESVLKPDALKGNSVADGLVKYEALLHEKAYLDYSGIMAEAARVLEADRELKQRLADRVKHVIVDEYQDTNPVQERVVRALHDLGAAICVVGDDDQTLYQWNGSSVENVLTFAKRYPKVKSIRMQENWRSSKGIVLTAREFIQQNAERLDKEMEPTDAQPYEAGDIVALGFETPEKEAEYIADTIKALHGVAITERGVTRGVTYADMAILLRSVKHSGKAILDALRKADIPFVIGGMNGLFETQEVQAARALFHFMAGLNVTQADLKDAWQAARLGIASSALQAAIANAEKARASMQHEGEARWALYNIQRTFMQFLEDTGLREEKVPGGPERGEIVFYNLGKFSQLISDFEAIYFHSAPKEKYESFANFLTYRADGSYPEGWQENVYATPNAVQIMTVHQAKGREWPVVFVPALVRNRFPTKGMGGRNVWHLLPDAAVEGAQRYRGGLEDERRLFYVAMTRSQKFLHMTWAPVPSGNNMFSRPSQFFDDVLASKHVKRTAQSYAGRRRATPVQKAAVSNVVLSFSELKYFYECAYQFKLRILYGFNAPLHEALGYGKTLHDALAEVHARATRGDIADPSEAAELISRHLNVRYAYSALREKLRESGERVVRGYLEKHSTDLRNVEFSEKAIEIHLGDGVSVAGRIDLVKRLDTGDVSIVDLKSSDRAQPENVTETQLHIYALGYEELTGRRADYVEIYELDRQKAKRRSIDDDLLNSVSGEVKRAAQALQSNTLPAQPAAPKCAACDFRGLCSAAAPAASGTAKTRRGS